MSKLLYGLGAAGVFAFVGAASAAVTINEIRIDQSSTDDSEYFELAGMAGESLDGLWYVTIGDGTGGSGVVETAIDLTGFSIPADGYFLAAESSFGTGSLALSGSVDFTGSGNALNFENSDNVTHMLVRNFSAAIGDDLDVDEDGVLDSALDILDSVALVETFDVPASGEYFYSPNTVGPDGSFVPGHVYRFANGTGPWNIGDFNGGFDTPGVANIPAPGAAALMGLGCLVASRRRRQA